MLVVCLKEVPELSDCRLLVRKYMCRDGQNRIYTPYITLYLMISLPWIPYIYRIYMVLANPIHVLWVTWLWLHTWRPLQGAWYKKIRGEEGFPGLRSYPRICYMLQNRSHKLPNGPLFQSELRFHLCIASCMMLLLCQAPLAQYIVFLELLQLQAQLPLKPPHSTRHVVPQRSLVHFLLCIAFWVLYLKKVHNNCHAYTFLCLFRSLHLDKRLLHVKSFEVLPRAMLRKTFVARQLFRLCHMLCYTVSATLLVYILLLCRVMYYIFFRAYLGCIDTIICLTAYTNVPSYSITTPCDFHT